MKTVFTLLLINIALHSAALGIYGKVVDEKKEPLISTTVQLIQKGTILDSTGTDYDGNYSFEPLEPGYYDIRVIYGGYDTAIVTKVILLLTGKTEQNFTLHPDKKSTIYCYSRLPRHSRTRIFLNRLFRKRD